MKFAMLGESLEKPFLIKVMQGIVNPKRESSERFPENAIETECRRQQPGWNGDCVMPRFTLERAIEYPRTRG